MVDGQTTLANLITQLAALNLSATSTRSGALLTLLGSFAAATGGTPANATLAAPGPNNDLTLTLPGEFNNYGILYQSVEGEAAPSVSVNTEARQITVFIRFGETTAAQVRDLLIAEFGSDITVAFAETNGSGIIHPARGLAGSVPSINDAALIAPSNFFRINNTVYFVVEGVDSRELYRIGGTLSAPTAVKRDVGIRSGTSIQVAGNAVFYVDATSGNLRRYLSTSTSAPMDLGSVNSFSVRNQNQVAVVTANRRMNALTLNEGSATPIITLTAATVQPWVNLVTATPRTGGLFVVEQIGNVQTIWTITGTTAVQVATLEAGRRVAEMLDTSSGLYFIERGGTSDVLRRLDGTTLTLVDAGTAGGQMHSLRLVSSTVNSVTTVRVAYAFTSGTTGALLRSVNLTADPAVTVSRPSLGNGTISQMTVVDGRLYFIFGSLRRGLSLQVSDFANESPVLRQISSTATAPVTGAQNLSVLNGALFFFANDGDTANVLWRTETTPDRAKPLVDFVDSVVPGLRIWLVDGAGDGIITSGDAFGGNFADHATLVLNTADTENFMRVDITELIREKLRQGITRVTFLLHFADPDAEEATLAHAHVANGTGLEVVTGRAATVTGSLFTQEGRLLQSNQAVIDLSQLKAGTYFLRINGPTDGISLIGAGTADRDPGETEAAVGGDYLYVIRNGILFRENGALSEPVRFQSGNEVLAVSHLREDNVDPDLITSRVRLLGGVGRAFYFTWGNDNNTELWVVLGQFATRVGTATTAPVTAHTAVGDLLIFVAGDRLFSATPEGTTLIAELGDRVVSNLTTAGDRAIFLLDGLWHSTRGTELTALDQIDPGSQSAGDIIAVNGELFYFVTNATGGLTLWRATPGEGQLYGAEPLRVNLLAQQTGATARFLGVLEGRFFFTVTQGTTTQLWISNGFGDPVLGGQGGTRRIMVTGPEGLPVPLNLGGEAEFLAVRDEKIFFTVRAGQNVSLWTVGISGLNGVAERIVDSLPGQIREEVRFQGQTYFISGTETAPMLWTLTESGARFIAFLPSLAQELTAAGSRLAFRADFIGDGRTNSLWVTDGTAAGIRMVIDLSPINPGTISGISGTANGIVFVVRNDAATVEGFVDYSLWTSNGFRDGTFPLLSANAGNLPFVTAASQLRPEHIATVGAIAFYHFNGRIIATDGTPRGTQTLATDFTPVAHAVRDGNLVLIDSSGNLRTTRGNLVGIPFKIEVKAPMSGRMHAPSDRDILIGGEGNDILIGNGDHDIIFGGGGINFFIAERKEIRDLQPFENFAPPPTSEFSIQQPRSPDAEVFIPDEALRAGIARALGIPVTEGFDGRPVIHGRIMASQMATLVNLQLNDLGIQSVIGLEFARNLRVLNLNGNRIGDLSILAPATDRITGATTGLSNLRVFSMDYNGMGILTFRSGEYLDIEAVISTLTATITFWFRTDAPGEQGLFSTDRGVLGDQGMDRAIFLTADGRIAARILDSNTGNFETIFSPVLNLNDGRWHHVAYVYNGTAGHALFVNGQEVARGTARASGFSLQTGLNLGFAQNDAGQDIWFTGDMDELRIWNAALDLPDINSDMIQDFPERAEDLVGYWSFDGFTGSVAIDHSLFRRNGIFGGGNPERAPAFNRMIPDPALRPTPWGALNLGMAGSAVETLFFTNIRDLGQLSASGPGPLEKVSLAYNRIDRLEPLSRLPNLNFINLTGVVNAAEPQLAVILDHRPSADETAPRLIEAKDGTRLVMPGDLTLKLSAGTWAWRRLTIGGGTDTDEIFTLWIENGRIHVNAFGVTMEYDMVDQIFFDGGNGDDQLIILGNFPVDIYAVGGAGNDTLMGGSANNFLFGGTGDDTLIIRGGTTLAAGGAGNDTYVFLENWGTATVNESSFGGTRDTFNFAAIQDDLVIAPRGVSFSGTNTVTHIDNTIERFIGGAGHTRMNLHRENGGLLDLLRDAIIWDGVRIEIVDIDIIDVRFARSSGERTGTVRVQEDLDYTGSQLFLEAGAISLNASLRADGLSLRAQTLISMPQQFNVDNGLGRLNLIEARELRLESGSGIGDIFMPLYFRANVVEAISDGAAGIYLAALGGLTQSHVEIGNVSFGDIGAGTSGLSTARGGNIHVVSLTAPLHIESEIQASGGGIVLTAERMQVNAEIASRRISATGQLFRGTLVVQTLSAFSSIGLATTGDRAGQTLHFTEAEMNRFMTGFDNSAHSAFLANGQLVQNPVQTGITIGRLNGRHTITQGAFTYSESITLRAPLLGGQLRIVGIVRLVPSLITGDQPSFTFLGGGQ